ncbi:MAG: serine/threonine-protein kinase [Planctomycetota bacterium]
MSEPETAAQDEHPTGALADTHVVTVAWETLQAQGHAGFAPEASLVGARTLNPADPGSQALGPATVDLAGLETLRLDGEDPQFRDAGLLGEGGMGQVRLAVDRGLRREVALKTVRDGAPDRERLALVQEAFFTGFLEHPNVVPVHRLGQRAGGHPVLVMKRVVGTSWLELLKDPEHPGWEDLPADRLRANLGILIRVCDAVRFAHSKGILHRDLKPANVMVGAFGEVYLVDWGVAVRIKDLAQLPPAIVGTPAYMAPEMLEEPTALSERTDVYLLGATLHHLLTGRPRHQASGQHALLHAVFRSEPQDYGPDVPDELASLCNAATHVDPAQRPEDALAFRRELERYLDHEGSITLTDRADDELARLRAGDEEDPGARRERFDACRFGYEQALEIWPENPGARAGLQACLEWGIERELTRRNRGLVESLLRALPEPRPALAAKLQALELELAREAAAPEELAALRREHDVGVWSRERAMALLWLTLLGLGVGLILMVGVELQVFVPSYPLFAVAGGAMGAVFAGVLFVYRRLLESRINRRLVGVVAAGYGGGMLVLATFWVYGHRFDVFLLSLGVVTVTVGAVTAVCLDTRLWIPTGIGAAAASPTWCSTRTRSPCT